MNACNGRIADLTDLKFSMILIVGFRDEFWHMMYMHHMPKYLPYIALGVLGIIWGTNFLFMKMAVAHVSPLQVAGLRTLFGAIPIVLLAGATGALSWQDRRYTRHFLAMALLANVGPYVFFVMGTERLPSGVAGAISGAIPCITALVITVSLPDERITVRTAFGLIIGLTGVLLIALGSDSTRIVEDHDPILGAFWMIAGSLSYALAIVYARRFMQGLGLGAVKLAAYQMVIACALLSLSFTSGETAALWADRNAGLGLVIGLGLIGTGVAFVIYYYLIAKLGALATASVYYIPPGVSLIVGALVLSEQIEAIQIIGALAILISIYVVTRQDRDESHCRTRAD